MGTYRVMRAIDRGYPLAVLWLYVGAFAVAMALMFVFPPGSLIMMGLGLASVPHEKGGVAAAMDHMTNAGVAS